MQTQTRALAAASAGADLAHADVTLPALGPQDLELRVESCGICHSDLHLLNDAWRLSRFPLVPGHEVVGRVVARGEAVADRELGQRLGVGWHCGACLDCELCRGGEEHLCREARLTCARRPGGLAATLRVDARFTHPIPAALTPEEASPLLCAGATVYAPLRRFGVASGTRVGVVGVGGLGHLALQFAQRLGAEVTAFSSSPDKADDARALGANVFVHAGAEGALKAQRGRLDLLLVTASANLDWDAYLRLLRPKGQLCLVGVPGEPLRFRAFPLLDQCSVTGSKVASPRVTREMLAFAGEHGIKPRVEPLFPRPGDGPWLERVASADVNQALARLRENRVRYRVVLSSRRPEE